LRDEAAWGGEGAATERTIRDLDAPPLASSLSVAYT
jgi:hypothetical protein